MIVAIAADARQKLALEQKGFGKNIGVDWVNASADLYSHYGSVLLIDCMFKGKILPTTSKMLIIHSPAYTISDMAGGKNVARFCAWNSFIEIPVWEMAIAKDAAADWLGGVMNELGWNFRLVADEPGFVAPRILSMIINEAYFALAEKISTREEINTAMKLGTNYPFGTFEWADKIGTAYIYELLSRLAETDGRYKPCPGMIV